MTLITPTPAGRSAFMCRLAPGGRPNTGTRSKRMENASTSIAGQAPTERHAAQYRICLECALPLRTSEQGQSLECRCVLAEAEDEWLDLNDWEFALIFALAISFMFAAFWLCF